MIIWITGLSGAGKTTVAKVVYDKLKEQHNNIILLDGDTLRGVLDSTGYSYQERYVQAEKIHRLCVMLERQGIDVVCATMSLFHKIQEMNREYFENYCEVYIDVELKELIRRDQKNIYSKAMTGQMENVVGIDIVPEVPISPHVRINNNKCNRLQEKVNQVLEYINIK